MVLVVYIQIEVDVIHVHIDKAFLADTRVEGGDAVVDVAEFLALWLPLLVELLFGSLLLLILLLWVPKLDFVVAYEIVNLHKLVEHFGPIL